MNAILKLVEKQIAMLDVRDRMGETHPQAVPTAGRYVTKDGAAFGPCLLISRECGSGGGLLSQQVGERLGWDVFDSKIVDEIARAAHVHQRLVQTVDEHVYSYLERTWREFFPDGLEDEKYLRHLKEVVTALGHLGQVVLVGRGAQFLLPSPCALRVRLVAPLEARMNRLAEHEKFSLPQARSKISEIDTARAAFIWKTFRKDVGSPSNHDLIINTGEVDIASATKIVLAAIEEKLGVRPGEKRTGSSSR
jgi:cytidylate kinase